MSPHKILICLKPIDQGQVTLFNKEMKGGCAFYFQKERDGLCSTFLM